MKFGATHGIEPSNTCTKTAISVRFHAKRVFVYLEARRPMASNAGLGIGTIIEPSVATSPFLHLRMADEIELDAVDL